MESPKAFGPFEVRGELGRGAGGVVYVAWHPEHDRTAAVKLYSAAPREASAAIARLKRDAQAAGALGHPNLAAVLGVGDHDGWPWVATEFVPGVSLAQVLRGRALLPVERVLDLWRQMCEGLAHAHREGVLHLDLKPADVRLAPSGEVKLVDFGSWQLKALEHGGMSRVDAGLHYRAPELLSGRRPDQRGDVFSVAAIIYELVAYRKAFPGESTTDVVRGLTRCEPDLACLPRTPFTPGFERVLAVSLARAPEARHASFEDVHADLVQLVRETAPRLRGNQASDSGESGAPEREELLASVTRARAEDRLEDALDACRRLLERDSEDESARRAMSEIESVLLEREVDTLVGMALSYAADGQLALATGIAEKVERLAPWSPRYLQLQVYLDEEGARHRADALVAGAREHLVAGRVEQARADALEASSVMPGHAQAARLVQELAEAPGSAAARTTAPAAPTMAPAEALPEALPEARPEQLPEQLPEAAAEATAEAQGAPQEALRETPAESRADPLPSSSEPPGHALAPQAPPPAGQLPPDAVASLAPGPAAVAPAASDPGPPAPKAQDPRVAEAVALSATALRLFLKDDHAQARAIVEQALALDPGNRRALELQKILRVLA